MREASEELGVTLRAEDLTRAPSMSFSLGHGVAAACAVGNAMRGRELQFSLRFRDGSAGSQGPGCDRTGGGHVE